MSKIYSLTPDEVEIIDLEPLREEPVMSLDAFREKMEQYSFADFDSIGGSHDPYMDVVIASRAQIGLFQQYSKVLLDVALSKARAEPILYKEDQEYYDEFIKSFIEHVKTQLRFKSEVLVDPNSIMEHVRRVRNDEATADKVSVMPLMCGSGKSTAITKLIIETIKKDDGSGMLIVTDSVDRIKKLWDPETTNPYLSDDEKEFIRQHNKDVTMLFSDNRDEARLEQKRSPVLMVTTQRYFNSWNRRDIVSALDWEKGHRELILFDEMPYLNFTVDLTPAIVNNIDTVLRMEVDDDPLAAEDKNWCIDQWAAFRDKFNNQLRAYEAQCNGEPGMIFHEEPAHAVTEDDERFIGFINRQRNAFRRGDPVSGALRAIEAFVKGWGLYSYRSSSSGRYESKITTFIDNRDKLTDLGAKVIVLDGTADISPTYWGQDYIDMRSGRNYERSLSKLTIRLCDIETARTKFESYTSIAIRNYLAKEGFTSDNTFIFTYKDMENIFHPNYRDRTAHFNDIKGSNAYIEADCIAQVGLNQRQPVHYLVERLARDEELLAEVRSLSPEESKEKLDEISRDNKDIATGYILADIEQNMFRSAIRETANQKEVTFCLFYKQSSMPQLKEKIEERYSERLGATVKVVSEEEITRSTERKLSAADKIMAWYTEWDGTPVRKITIYTELGIKRVTFNKAINSNRELRRLFDEAEEKAKAMKKPDGYIAR